MGAHVARPRVAGARSMADGRISREHGRRGGARWRAVLCLLPCAALAGGAVPLTAASPVDLDDDGSISLREFAAGWEREFELRDADGDGVLSMHELFDVDAPGLVDAFATYDASGNGAVDAREYEQRLRAEFGQLDLDADALLDRFELFQASAPEDRRLTLTELELLDRQLDAIRAELGALGFGEGGNLADGVLDALLRWLRSTVAPKMVQLSLVRMRAEQAAVDARRCSGAGLDAYEHSVARLAEGAYTRDERHLIELHAQRMAHGLLAARAMPGRTLSFVKLFIAAALVRMSTRALDARRIVADAAATLDACPTLRPQLAG